MSELFLVILCRQGILSGHILKQQERDGELSRGIMWKKAPLQNYSSFHPNLVMRNQVFQQEVFCQTCF